MSDERIFDSVDGLPDPDLDPTAALLRDVLTREADAVQPALDGLTRIRSAIEAEAPRTSEPGRFFGAGRGGARLHRPGGLRRWTPVLAAAAAVVLLAGIGGIVATRWPVIDRFNGAAKEPPVSAPRQLPVYTVGTVTRPGGQLDYALFREFRTTTARGVDDRLSQALTEAVLRWPNDADYDRVFGGGGPSAVVARWNPDAGTTGEIDVKLTPAMVTVKGATDARAYAAVQQIVWTATAVLSETRPNAADVPVRISIRGATSSPYLFGRRTYPLGGLFSRAHGPDDPSAPVWIVDPGDADVLGRAVTDARLNVGYTGRAGVPWTLTRDGAVVASGTALPGFTNGAASAMPGSRGVATIQIDHTRPGDYLLTVTEPATEAEPRWSDSKSFTVN